MGNPRAITVLKPMHPRYVIAVATALDALDGFDVLSVSFAFPSIARICGINRPRSVLSCR